MNISLKLALTLAILLPLQLIASCSSGGSGSSSSTSSTVPDRPVDDAALEELNGVWEQRGYGNLFVLDGNRTTLYSLAEATCLEINTFEGVAGISAADLERTRFGLEGDELILAIPGGAFPVRLSRLDALPTRCDEPVANDTQAVFDYVWNTYDEYYAFFDLHDVDWSAEYARLSPRIGEVENDADLFALLSDLLTPLDDNTVQLFNDDNFFSPGTERGALPDLREGFEAQSDTDDFGDYVDSVFNQFQLAVASRMDPSSVTQQGPLTWATASNGTVGYVFIDDMSGFVLDDNGETREDTSDFDDLQAARAAMDQVMADLATTSRMIVDLRFNTGGLDSIALDFASRFVSDRQLAFSKTARSQDFESMPVEASLEPPETGAYLNPVALIIGANTAGAAEVFAIPMHRQPQVTLIGERTAGALSDQLVKPLPNRWVTTLSNEVYRDSEGESFEHVGLSPAIEVSVFELDDILAGEDSAVDRALSLP